MELLNEIAQLFGMPRKRVVRRSILTSDVKNPWPGLSAYDDPLKILLHRKFSGRDREIFEMTQLIDNNVFVTLYGKSGNGKTSLLNAGVFPQLRKMQYVPFSIRLSVDALSGISFQECIIKCIEKYFTPERMEVWNVVRPTKEREDVEYLWNYFARHRFFADEQHSQPVYPVIVLDQFEEVFRTRRKDTETLLKQINFMAEEDNRLEDYESDGELYSYEYNFRFVVSIREDDLFWLEDCIDNNLLYSMKQNRFRLRALTNQGGRDAILIPGEGLFIDSEKDKIVKTILDIARGSSNEISSNVLSLICSRIYAEYQSQGSEGVITLDLVNKFVSKNPLEQFYLEATEDLSNSERAYLEDNLVDLTGRRGFISEANFKQIFKRKADALLNGNRKILQASNGRIELIHDSFCQVLTDQKAHREKMWQNIIEHLGLMFMSLLLCYKLTLYVPFLFTYTANSLIAHIADWALESVDYFSLVFLFMVSGVVRKSFPDSFIWIALTIIILPLLAPFLMDEPPAPLPLMYHVVSLFLLAFTIAACFYNRRHRPKDAKNQITYSDLLDFHSVRLWTLVTFVFMIYYYVYVAPLGWYVSNVIFAAYLIIVPTLFYSIFESKESRGTCWVLLFILMPVVFLLYYLSDTEFLAFSEPLSPALLLPVFWLLGCPLYIIWSASEDTTTTRRVLRVILFCAVIFGFYALLYKHKLLMLAIWSALSYLFVYLMTKGEQKNAGILCLATFIVTLAVYTFTRGYNPMIRNVRIEGQKGEWHWNTVMAKTDDSYHLIDGLTGHDMLEIGFDEQDENLNLVKKLDHRINVNYEIINSLYEISYKDSTIVYKSRPRFEQLISRESRRKKPAATIFKQHRKWFFGEFINPDYHRPADSTRPVVRELVTSELAAIESLIATQNDSIMKHDLPEELCRALSSSWLYNATDSIGVIGDDYYFNYLCSFNYFTSSHFYETVNQEMNSDWDGTFETIADKYIECMTALHLPARDEFLATLLPRLISVYDGISDYGLKTLLYGKIVRMQQIAILQGLGDEEWSHMIIESPVNVDIHQFYLSEKGRWVASPRP